MNTPNFRQTGDLKESDTDGLRDAGEVAREAVEGGEECVRAHPFSSIGVAFGGGLVLGLLIGWSLAEEKHEDVPQRCRRLLRDWQRRLHLS